MEQTHGLSFKAALEELTNMCRRISTCQYIDKDHDAAMQELLQAVIKVVTLQPDRVPSQNAVLVKDNVMLRSEIENLRQDNTRLAKENIKLHNMISEAQSAFKGFI